jgi:hypothetical protein
MMKTSAIVQSLFQAKLDICLCHKHVLSEGKKEKSNAFLMQDYVDAPETPTLKSETPPGQIFSILEDDSDKGEFIHKSSVQNNI